MNDRNDRRLEQLVEDACSGLPLRRAPAGLERCVLDEIARRAALPWWRRGFVHWPIAARAGFVVVCVLLAGLSLTRGFTPRFDMQALGSVRSVVGLMSSVGNTATLLARLLPTPWIYLTLGVAALLYLLLFGLGAFAYRALYLPPSNTTMIRS